MGFKVKFSYAQFIDEPLGNLTTRLDLKRNKGWWWRGGETGGGAVAALVDEYWDNKIPCHIKLFLIEKK